MNSASSLQSHMLVHVQVLPEDSDFSMRISMMQRRRQYNLLVFMKLFGQCGPFGVQNSRRAKGAIYTQSCIQRLAGDLSVAEKFLDDSERLYGEPHPTRFCVRSARRIVVKVCSSVVPP